MYLMEDRKLLDAQVFNGRQILLKVYLQTFFLWIFESFVPFHTFINKSIRCPTSFCRKKTANLTGKKSWRL